MLPYPYFPDIRADGLAADSGITAGLGQLTMTWAAPIQIDPQANAQRQVVRLIESSPAAWTSAATDVQPDLETYPELGFARGADTGRKLLGVLIEGRFDSAFRDAPSPLLEDASEPDATADTGAEGNDPRTPPVVSGVVEHSPSTARLILLGSPSFLSDTAIGLATEATQSRYLAPVTLVENAIDWSLEDRGLLALRGRGQYSRLLEPVGREQRMLIESLNYLLALGGLTLIYALHRRLRRRREQTLAAILEG